MNSTDNNNINLSVLKKVHEPKHEEDNTLLYEDSIYAKIDELIDTNNTELITSVASKIEFMKYIDLKEIAYNHTLNHMRQYGLRTEDRDYTFFNKLGDRYYKAKELLKYIEI